MRNLYFIITIIFLMTASVLKAQEEEDNQFGIKFSGFIKTDLFYDSRQTVAAREGHFLLWPTPELLDRNNEDSNAGGNFNMLALQTRLKGIVTGPDALGAKTSGIIEGAFFGVSNSGINGFRLRHAFMKLNWTNTELLVGQYWHPMFVTANFPGTVSFNTGTPFQPFSRNPQVRLTHSLGALKAMVAIVSQRDFTSPGGSTALRNSGKPDMQVQLMYHSVDIGAKQEFLLGAGAGYKTIRPRLVTDSLYKTNSSVKSISLQGFLKYSLPALTFKLEATYGQNMHDLSQISSYAVQELSSFDQSGESITVSRDYRKYVPLNNYSIWSEVHTNGKVFQAGLFVGYTKNTGTRFFGFGESLEFQQNGSYVFAGERSNIDHVWRISPRVLFNAGKVRFATELETTAAAFGEIDANGAVINAKEVKNTRLLIAVYYFF